MNENQRNQGAMQMIKQSGILNPNATLNSLFNVTQELNKSVPGDEMIYIRWPRPHCFKTFVFLK